MATSTGLSSTILSTPHIDAKTSVFLSPTPLGSDSEAKRAAASTASKQISNCFCKKGLLFACRFSKLIFYLLKIIRKLAKLDFERLASRGVSAGHPHIDYRTDEDERPRDRGSKDHRAKQCDLCCRVTLEKKFSTALSQEAEVGVKWKVQRGWRDSQASTPAFARAGFWDVYEWHSCRGRRESACQPRLGARRHWESG
jgi:hypothetical protein